MSKLASVYDPQEYEKRLYDFWMDQGFFKASRDSGKPPYTILMPPPNVTAQLHMGHGTGYTMQDILIRWKRMQGFDALWLPGTDHAGIATQMMVEKSLAAEGTTRQEIGRDAFTERLWAWKDKYGGAIHEQFKKLGFSCDWDRMTFTMDENLSKAVRHIFVDLYKEGLIYRGERLVNWDPVLKTAISDDEVETKEITGKIWHFRYPIDGTEDFVTIATTRPETMLGDTAVAVHPEDERYQHLVGKFVRLPFVDRLIPIVADDYVKQEFGSGCVKITPAHDQNDFELGKRHNLEIIDVMNDDATMNDKCPAPFRGLNRFDARKEVIKGLEALGLFEKDEKHKNAIPHSERSKEIIEPRLSKQWYVKMQTLAQPAVEAAKSGDLKFYPDMWKKTYLHWMENIQDWCISRQLWWGHRIPIWYCKECDATTTDYEDPTSCSGCGSSNIHQDEDVLDTWFSSWLWPVSPFGWPEQTEDLKHFYPSDVLVTAPEIIFLWVARMVMVGQKTQNNAVPFPDVFMTATVCDKQGRKFSKTLGNGIDPFDVIDKHGTDAVRFTAVHIAPLGGRIKMAEEDFEVGARFINKIWNASRFALGYATDDFSPQSLKTLTLTKSDQWLIEGLAECADKVGKGLSAYRINDAVHALYHYIWGSFCDWGIETAKKDLSGDPEKRDRALSVLVYALDGIMRLASPVMPFVSEEIWRQLPAHPDWDRPESLVVAKFPEAKNLMRFTEGAKEWAQVQDLISGIRSIRSQAGIAPKQQLKAHIRATDTLTKIFSDAAEDIKRLAKLSDLHIATNAERPGQSMVAVGNGYEAYIPAEGLIDIEVEKERLNSEIKRITKIVGGLTGKLGNKSFVDRAPEDVVAQTKAQKENLEGQLESLATNLDALS